MPGKLIAFIVTLLIIVTFIGFNIEHTSDIRIWFGEKGLLTNVPIFVSFFVMYLVGVLSVIPFLMSWTYRRNHRPDNMPEEPEGKPERNVRVLGGKKRKKADEDGTTGSELNPASAEPTGEIPPEDAP